MAGALKGLLEKDKLNGDEADLPHSMAIKIARDVCAVKTANGIHLSTEAGRARLFWGGFRWFRCTPFTPHAPTRAGGHGGVDKASL